MNRQIKMQDIVQYTLSDYQFLQDYEVIDSYKSNKNSFVACIRNSEQKVRFVKRKYNHNTFQRFKVLHKLYKNGIILCDSLFILEECDEYYFYVIEAEIQHENPRFQTLQHYLYYSELNQQERKALLSKIKILIDCLHQQGQYYAGIDTRKIIIDDQKHIYLAPYDLEFELKTDNFSRAYYPPELLMKISKLQPQISQQMMQKWDIWAFGCIAFEIMGYSCPYFMSTSLSKQLKSIQKFNVSEHFQQQQQPIRCLLANSLCFDDSKRSLLACERQQLKGQPEMLNLKQSLKQIGQINNQENNLNMFRQLNICPNHYEKSDTCEFVLNLISLKNVSFQKQLKISVYLNRIYHIYLDFDQKNPSKYKLNRKITIKGSFNYFQTLLASPVKIQFKEQEKISEIFVHLQALVLTKQAKRIWTEPILGTYTATNGDFSRSKLQISSVLSVPDENLCQETVKQNRKLKQKVSEEKNVRKTQSNKEKIDLQTEKNEQLFSEVNILKDTTLKIGNKNKNACLSKLDKIPSISEIAEQITLITQTFKKKISIGQPQKENNVQKKLTSLLKIESLAQ